MNLPKNDPQEDSSRPSPASTAASSDCVPGHRLLQPPFDPDALLHDAEGVRTDDARPSPAHAHALCRYVPSEPENWTQSFEEIEDSAEGELLKVVLDKVNQIKQKRRGLPEAELQGRVHKKARIRRPRVRADATSAKSSGSRRPTKTDCSALKQDLSRPRARVTESLNEKIGVAGPFTGPSTEVYKKQELEDATRPVTPSSSSRLETGDCMDWHKQSPPPLPPQQLNFDDDVYL